MGEPGVFVGALAIAYLVPGPDMVLLLQTGATQGRAHAVAVAVGLAIARAVHVAFAALGLAALLGSAPLAFEMIRFAGAAYLIWLGIGIFRTPSLLPSKTALPSGGSPPSYGTAARRGLLNNLLNPKALLFCSVLLPHFIRPEQGGVPAQFLLLGIILVCIGITFDVVYAFAGGTLGRWTARHPKVQSLQRWAFASLLIGFGARLAFAARP